MSRASLTNHVGAVVLVVRLAKFALQTSSDLSTDANAISNLDSGHLVANLDGLADNLVANANGEGAFAPAPIDGVDIGATDTTALDLDVDVTVFKLLWFELVQRLSMLSGVPVGRQITHLFLLEVSPFALVLDHEPFEGIRISHIGAFCDPVCAIECNLGCDYILECEDVWK